MTDRLSEDFGFSQLIGFEEVGGVECLTCHFPLWNTRAYVRGFGMLLSHLLISVEDIKKSTNHVLYLKFAKVGGEYRFADCTVDPECGLYSGVSEDWVLGV